ncbi:MAG: HAMP domain-containing histidine kinase [Anaerolineae bacterium]|nr:HAMP domain-containing histidine kinase [Anaerolineae bacterium]MDW8173134.1 HAMP domain-containing sensor histidine kinase [Anaerolineae bacterium]
MKESLDLLNDFAHDLKMPLSAAKGFLELAQISQNAEQAQAFTDKAYKNVGRALRIVEELLDYARTEAQQTIDHQRCDLRLIVEETLVALEMTIRSHNLTIIVDPSVDEVELYGDPNLLRHAFANLVGNAIKYNRHGGMVRLVAHDEGAYIRVDVIDTGIGIDSRALPRVFERFFRADAREVKRLEGTGLGLAIVRTAIEKHGGRVAVQSQLGQGSTFSVWLPTLASSAALTLTGHTAQTQRNSLEVMDALDDSLQESPDDTQDDSRSDEI